MGPGTSFAFQHDVRVRSESDRVVTLFDNGGGPPRAHQQSRGLRLALDLKRMTATRAAEYEHAAALAANYEGNLQQLADCQSLRGGASSLTSHSSTLPASASSMVASSNPRPTTAPTSFPGTAHPVRPRR